MTQKNKLPPWLRKRTAVLPWLQRINAILATAWTDLRPLQNGAWERLMDSLHVAIFNTPRNRNEDSPFNDAARKRTPVWDALETLRKEILKAEQDDTDFIRLPLEKSTLEIRYVEDSWGGIYDQKFEARDFATMLFLAFGHVMNASMVTRSDFRICANESCKTPFFPLRKRDPKVDAFCKPGCARIVAARNYRAKKKKAAKKKKR